MKIFHGMILLLFAIKHVETILKTMIRIFILSLILSLSNLFSQEAKPYILKKNSERYKFFINSRLPETAPNSFLAASFLQIQSLEYLFPVEFLPIHTNNDLYVLPDGKFTIGKNFWRWEKTEGLQVIKYHGSHIVLKYKNHRITEWLKRNDNRIEWVFPDNSRLVYFNHPATNSPEYIYKNKLSSYTINYRVIQPGFWLSEVETFEPYEIHFNRSYNHYVYLLKELDLFHQLPKFIKEYTGAESYGMVPILLFDDVYEYRKFLKDQSAEPGSIGFRDMVVHCCEDYKLADFSLNTRDTSPPIELIYRSLLKGITEHILVRGCYAKNPNQDEYSIKRPFPFFTAALTEMFLGDYNSSYLAFSYKQYHRSIDTFGLPNLYKEETNQIYSVFSMMTMNYLLKTYGEAGLEQLYEEMCLSKSEDIVLQKVAGVDLTTLYETSNLYYSKNRDLYSGYKQINLGTFYRYLQPTLLNGYEKLPQYFIFPNSIFDISNIPHFFYAYRAYLPSYKELIKQHFKKNEKGNLFEIKLGNYEVRDGMYKIFHKLSSDSDVYKVVLEYAGHTIVNYKNDEREWILPDGSKAVFSKKEIRYYNRNGTELKKGEENYLYETTATLTTESVSLDKTEYKPGEPISISFSGLNPVHKNFIVLTKKTNSDSIIENVLTLTTDKGTVIYTDVPLVAGVYEIRLYTNWPFTGLVPIKKIEFSISNK
jgi:hypothetical protein